MSISHPPVPTAPCSRWKRRDDYEYMRTPSGVTYVRVCHGDGEEGRWPGNDPSRSLVKKLGPHGEANYYIPLGKGPDDSKEPRYVRKYERYMKMLGRAFARHVLNKDEALVTEERAFDPDTCTLASFPAGYKLFVHINTRPLANTRKDRTHDGYLFGSAHRFRSPVEFFPHLLWLARGAGPHACGCPYCSDTSLRAIGRAYFSKSPRKQRVRLPSPREESAMTREARRARRSAKRKRDAEAAQTKRNHAESGQRRRRRDAARTVGSIELGAGSTSPSHVHMDTAGPSRSVFPAPAPRGRPRRSAVEHKRDGRAHIGTRARCEGSGPHPGSSDAGYPIRGAASMLG